jgi:hypothetical protein
MPWITYLNRDGRDSRPLGGPYATLDDAKADLPRVRANTEQADPFAFFDNFRSAEANVSRTLFGNGSAVAA